MSIDLDMPIGILGFGVEGKSTLRYLVREGAKKIIVMDKANVALDEIKGVQVEIFSGKNYLEALSKCRVVIRSAGVYPHSQELLAFEKQGGILLSQAEIFFEVVSPSRIIGVTGTFGKGSTISMIKHIFDYAEKPCAIGGNFGVPMLDLLENLDEETILLLELSSFQLMTLSKSPRVGVLLKITTEHLDWHKNVEEYRDAKANLVRYQNRNDFCVFSSDSPVTVSSASLSSAQKLSFGNSPNAACYVDEEKIQIGTLSLNLSECSVRAAYQLENMAAALLASLAFEIDIQTIFSALKTYRSLPLRSEFLLEKSGIEFYNDSYSTRPEATIASTKSMKRPFALILGGSEKNADFSEMFEALSQNKNLKQIALIGATAERMKEAALSFQISIPIEIFETLESAFKRCVEIGRGGAVLLSPACASFGLFKNYKARGEAFNRLVSEYDAPTKED